MPSTGTKYAKAIKECFTAEPNHIFYMVDYSALEDRVIANLSKDKNKCSIFLENVDGHCLNSYFYFKDEIEKILPRKDNEELFNYIKRYKEEIDNGNNELKAIRQKSKGCTFGLSYGAFPPKIAESTGMTIEEATNVFNKYHNELYPDITKFREKVINRASKAGGVHLGLGCMLYSNNVHRDERTLFNAMSQFWSILTLLTINKLHHLIDLHGLKKEVEIVSTIYDSIYLHVKKDPYVIKWVNDTVIDLLTKDFLEDQIVPNQAQGEIGYNWYKTSSLTNNASIEEIKSALHFL